MRGVDRVLKKGLCGLASSQGSLSTIHPHHRHHRHPLRPCTLPVSYREQKIVSYHNKLLLDSSIS